MPVFLKESEFSEAQYQSLIESIFRSDFRNGVRFEIDYFAGEEERRLGYDMEVKTYIPIFLQMKRSNMYLGLSNNKEMKDRANTFRFKDSPGAYFFHLHVDNITKDYKQHNLLYHLSKDGSYARYIAPLFIERSLLQRLFYDVPAIYWNSPYPRILVDNKLIYDWRDYFYMEHSVLINPHKEVHKQPNELHKYFFNRGLEISFHSEPEKINNENIESLVKFIERLNVAVYNLEPKESGNITEIFKKIIDAIKSTFNNLEDWEENEITIFNIINERFIFEDELIAYKSFSEIEPSFNNLIMLDNYLIERFKIYTLLISKRENIIRNFL